MRPSTRAFLLGVTLINLIGCGDPSGPPLSLTGEWVGTADGRTITLVLTDAEGDIAGTGSITNPANTLNAGGSRDARQVSIDVLVGTTSVSLFSLEGSLSGDHIDGTVDGAGFSSATIRLSRD
ncbi:MAG: hypothetical protein IPJ78_02410 [Gemmatimonadetes bacterium]|jgi:hypothetical protein|nr:hypothetical protein [Gemmatimonadota bacterium]